MDFIYLPTPPPGADEVSWMSGQVIAVICDEVDGFTLCDDTQGYDYTFKV